MAFQFDPSLLGGIAQGFRFDQLGSAYVTNKQLKNEKEEKEYQRQLDALNTIYKVEQLDLDRRRNARDEKRLKLEEQESIQKMRSTMEADVAAQAPNVSDQASYDIFKENMRLEHTPEAFALLRLPEEYSPYVASRLKFIHESTVNSTEHIQRLRLEAERAKNEEKNDARDFGYFKKEEQYKANLELESDRRNMQGQIELKEIDSQIEEAKANRNLKRQKELEEHKRKLLIQYPTPKDKKSVAPPISYPTMSQSADSITGHLLSSDPEYSKAIAKGDEDKANEIVAQYRPIAENIARRVYSLQQQATQEFKLGGGKEPMPLYEDLVGAAVGEYQQLEQEAEARKPKEQSVFDKINNSGFADKVNSFFGFNGEKEEPTQETSSEEEETLNEARAAIEAGADPNEVAKRLQEAGIDPRKL